MPVQLTCAGCGVVFPVKASWALVTKYCNWACYDTHRPDRLPGPDPERFWKKVDRGPGCWLWTGVLNHGGYGDVRLTGPGRKHVLAHRYSWELHVGPIPDGLLVRHLCERDYPPGDTTCRRCVRPDHLALGTVADNMADLAASGRYRARGAPRAPRALPAGSHSRIDPRIRVAKGVYAELLDLSKREGLPLGAIIRRLLEEARRAAS